MAYEVITRLSWVAGVFGRHPHIPARGLPGSGSGDISSRPMSVPFSHFPAPLLFATAHTIPILHLPRAITFLSRFSMLQQHLARYSRLAQGVYNAPRRGPRAFVLIICVVAFLIITTSFWISGPVPWETPRLLFAGPFATNHEDWRTRKPSASLIPPKIWQIMLPKGNLPKDWAPDPETLQDTLSWVTKNTDYA